MHPARLPHPGCPMMRSARTPSAFLLAATLLAGLVVPATLHIARAQSAGLDAETVTAAIPALEDYVARFMAEAGIPGVAIGIVAGDRLVHARGYGQRAQGGMAAVDADTVFQIGSITKSFAAGTEAVLVDRGQLAWSDRVIDHVPGFQMADPWVTREFRIVDLLAQRSGLTPYVLGEMVLFGYSRAETIAALRHVQPVSSFRLSFGYQNALHLVAERVVMAASGAPSWEAFLQSAILDPLGMAATSTTAEAIEGTANHATGHSRSGGRVHPIPFSAAFYNVGAAGNINSNVPDMSQWLRLQINRGTVDGRKVLGADALTHTWLPQVPVVEGMSYASGLAARSDPAGRVIWHNGGTTGFASFMGFDPDRKVGIVVLTNLALPGAGDAIGNRFLDMVRGLPETDHAAALLAATAARDAALAAIPRDPPADAWPPRPLAAYAGRYDSPVFGPVDVVAAGTGLAVTIGPAAIRIGLTPWSGDTFAAHVPDHDDLGVEDPMGFVQFEPGVLGTIRALALDLDTGDLDSPERFRFVRSPK